MNGRQFAPCLLGIALGAGLLGGCGSDTGESAQPAPSSAVPTPPAATTAPPAESTTTSTHHPAADCAVAELRIDVGPGGAAAGTTGFPVVFTNTGGRGCTLAGFPGVSYANGPAADPIGSPAARIGDSGAPVSIAPGQQASALVLAVNVQNYPDEKCHSVAAAGLRIYPPNSYDSAFVARSGTACSLIGETTQLKVNPIVAGASGQ